MCTRCGEKAFRRYDEYEGCVQYWLCQEHYEERCGPYLRSDFEEGEDRPLCEQCGEPGFKKWDNGHTYCKRHFKDQIGTQTENQFIIRNEYKADYEWNKEFFPETFGIIKDEAGLMR